MASLNGNGMRRVPENTENAARYILLGEKLDELEKQYLADGWKVLDHSWSSFLVAKGKSRVMYYIGVGLSLVRLESSIVDIDQKGEQTDGD